MAQMSYIKSSGNETFKRDAIYYATCWIVLMQFSLINHIFNVLSDVWSKHNQHYYEHYWFNKLIKYKVYIQSVD